MHVLPTFIPSTVFRHLFPSNPLPNRPRHGAGGGPSHAARAWESDECGHFDDHWAARPDGGAASGSGLPRSASSELKAWHFGGWTDKLIMGKTIINNNKPSPSYHHFLVGGIWLYGYHSQSWMVYDIVLPTLHISNIGFTWMSIGRTASQNCQDCAVPTMPSWSRKPRLEGQWIPSGND